MYENILRPSQSLFITSLSQTLTQSDSEVNYIIPDVALYVAGDWFLYYH